MSQNFISGIVSGIDSAGLIDALIAARSRPITLLQQRQAAKSAELAAWKSFEAILVSLKVETDRLGNGSLWTGLNVASSDEEVLTATAGSSTAVGQYEFFAAQLATSHQIRSQLYTNADEPVGAGTFTITVGGDETSIEVGAAASLDDLADLINESDANVSATVVRTVEAGEEGFYLVLTGKESGEANSISIGSTLSGGTAPDMTTDVRVAQDAIVRLGAFDGLEIRSETNTFEDIVRGLDLTIHRVQEDTDPPVTISVGRNVDGIEEAISSFVEIYNTAIGFVNDQFRYNPDVGTRPPLMGNATLTGLAGRLRSTVTGLVAGLEDDAAFRSLYAIGLRPTATGTLSLNTTTLQEALAEDFEAVADLFRPSARFDAGGVEWLSAPLGVDLAGVQHEIVITEAATRARLVGEDIDFSSGITIDGANDDFRIAVNGVLSEPLTIAHGTYTSGEELAAAIGAAIADSEDLGLLNATVSFEGDPSGVGRMVITSTSYGSDQTLKLHNAGGDFASTFGFSALVGESIEGTDVVGTIDGVTATGDGQILTSNDEDGGTNGLSFRITLEDSGVPATIVATFSAGAGRTASTSLAQLTDPADGTVARLGNSLQRLIDDIARNVDRKTEQLDLRRQRLVRQYAALESTLGRLQSQGAFLTAQINSISGGFGLNGNE